MGPNSVLRACFACSAEAIVHSAVSTGNQSTSCSVFPHAFLFSCVPSLLRRSDPSINQWYWIPPAEEGDSEDKFFVEDGGEIRFKTVR